MGNVELYHGENKWHSMRWCPLSDAWEWTWKCVCVCVGGGGGGGVRGKLQQMTGKCGSKHHQRTGKRGSKQHQRTGKCGRASITRGPESVGEQASPKGRKVWESKHQVMFEKWGAFINGKQKKVIWLQSTLTNWINFASML